MTQPPVITELVEPLEAQGVQLWFEGRQLRFRAPRGTLLPEQRNALAARRDEVAAALRARESERATHAPLSYGQRSLWMVHQENPGSAAYNVAFVVSVACALDREHLHEALQALVDRHAILRTAYEFADEGPCQRIAGAVPAVLDVHERPGLDDTALHALLAADYARPFDLARGPVWRTTLVTRGPADHVLMICAHHIAIDGWSLLLLLDELRQWLGGLAQGKAPVLPRPEPAYADYVQWQQQMLAGAEGQALARYWQDKLRAPRAELELPTDRPRPARRSARGASLEFALPAPLMRRLQLFAKAEGSTLFVLMLAAFKLLLHRWTGLEDIVVGTPTLARSKGQFDHTLGDFMNPVPLRTEVQASMSFRELLAAVRGTLFEALDHQDFPFARIVEQLQPARDPSRSPLFETFFVLQRFESFDELSALLNAGPDDPFTDFGGLQVRPYPLPQQEGQFDLGLGLVEVGGSLSGALKYNPDLFDASMIERLLGHYLHLLEALLAQPTARIDVLPMLGDDERRQLLLAHNATAADYPREQTVHGLFEAQARRTPEATAVRFEGQNLSYGELNRRANQLAHHLRALGVGSGALAGVCMERSFELLVALLGIQKAGGAYVPLDPGFPPDRLAYMLADSRAVVLITAGDAAVGIELPQGLRVVDLDAEAALLAAQPPHNSADGASLEDPAYVIYTSGSTGRPKGVAVPHGALVNFLESMRREPGLTASDVLAAVTTISFDIAGLELYLPLMVGARIELVSRATATDGEALARCLADCGATVLQATPATWRLLIEAGWSGSRHLRALCGGEALPRDLADALLPRVAELWNLYGPTETTIWSTLERVQPGSDAIMIGRPIANTQVYILDHAGEPAPIGVPGEIWIGGAGVALGYHRRPELTAERFVPDRFRGTEGARLYCTGDLGRWRADGRLEHLGRLDHQVKIRGFRIELGEIEAALNGHPAVRQAVVVAHEIRPGDKRLVAYLVTSDQSQLGAVRAKLAAALPDYMVPAAYVFLDALPLTPNGKIDRKALPAPERVEAEADKPHLPPATITEQTLAAIWSEVLGIARVGRDDNFFELGGHSLLATRLASRIGAAFGIELPVRRVFEMPGLRALAEHVDALRGVAPAEQPALRTVPRDGRLAASFAQERLWFFDQFEPGSSVYNLPVAWCLRGTLDVAALQAAFNDITARHEMLRTSFAAEDDQVFQRIHPPAPWTLPWIDLSATPNDDARALHCLREEAQCPFDLEQGPLLRALLVRQAPEIHWLVVTFHHIAADGWASELFARELAALYAARVKGQDAALPPLPIQYADYAHWQRQRLAEGALAPLLAYWKQQLAGAPAALELPLDRPRPAVQTFEGAVCTRIVEPPFRDRLLAFSHTEGSTLFVTLLAAFNVILARHSGQEDLCVGVPVAGRESVELEHLIGLFINTIIVRTRIDPAASFRTLLGQVRETFLGAYAHQDAPFEMVVNELAPERDLSRTPLFQVLVNMLNFGDTGAGGLPGLTMEPAPVSASWQVQSKFDLTLYLRDEPTGLMLAAVYNKTLFDVPRIEQMLDQYTQLLRVVTATPEVAVMQVPLVTPAAAALLPDPARPLHAAWIEPVHERFRHHAVRAPERVAVIDARGALGYGELERESNRLANYLAAQGVGREDLVAIYADRSAGLAWALLGVLKAGAGFMLLDPAHPPSRAVQCLRATRPKAWIQLEGAGPRPAEIDDALAAMPVMVVARWPASSCMEPESWCQCSTEPLARTVGADDLAYVALTSGSTGIPKVIAGTQRPLVHFFEWHTQTWELGPRDRFSVLSGLAHDPLLRDVLGALWAGATACMPDAARIGNPGYLGDWLAEQEVTVCHLTPAMADLVTLWSEGDLVRTLPALRHVFFGGDLLRADTVAALRAPAPAATYVNFYGATETPQAMGWYVVPECGDVPERMPLGCGIDDVQLLVLNTAGIPAGIGELGEICVRTPYLARGYVDDEALTAQRFVLGPARTGADDRMYRTGDLGRYRPDGTVEFAGREDDQVKVRGFRVELGEVEAALRLHPTVSDVAVSLRADGGREARLVGYVVPKAGTVPAGADELRGFLRVRLPEYMVPAHFVPLERLPLTPNGKLDRRRLPAPTMSTERSRVPPQTATQIAIASIWREVLAADEVGAEDNFFELGGHSLMATRVLSRLRANLGLDLPLRALFEAPTVAGLARIVDATCSNGSARSTQREDILI